MWTHVGNAPIVNELFPLHGMDTGLSCRMVRHVAVIDLRDSFGQERSVHALYNTVHELLEEGARDFAVNLTEVAVADSYTLGALAGAYNLVREAGGRIKFFAAPEKLVRAFRKFHLHSVLELYASEASALSSLQ